MGQIAPLATPHHWMRDSKREGGSTLANSCLERPSRGDETRNVVSGKMPRMKITTGIVVDGKVVVEGESLPDGATVTEALRDDEETSELTPEEVHARLDPSAQISQRRLQ